MAFGLLFDKLELVRGK